MYDVLFATNLVKTIHEHHFCTGTALQPIHEDRYSPFKEIDNRTFLYEDIASKLLRLNM